MFGLIAVVAAVSLISPAFEAVGSVISGTPYTLVIWAHAYAASGVLFPGHHAVRPALAHQDALQAHPDRASDDRRRLCGLDRHRLCGLLARHNQIFGIPLVYLLLVPLFVIALRLRPRFVTLALLLTSLFAIIGAFAGTSGTLLGARLLR